MTHSALVTPQLAKSTPGKSSRGNERMAEADLHERLREIHDYRLTHGMLTKQIVKRDASRSTWERLSRHVLRQSPAYEDIASTSTTRPLAVSTLPIALPKRLFEHARELQTSLNVLYMRVANDHAWLRDTLSPLLKHDVLLARLWSIYLTTCTGRRQDVVCGIFRPDYLDDAVQSCLKQVEMNVFSALSFAHAHNVARLHQHLQKVLAGQAHLPRNDNPSPDPDKAAASLSGTTTPRKTCILMVVQPHDFNIADERPIEYALWDRNVPCYRCEWQDVSSRTRLSDDGTLLLRLPHSQTLPEISVVYYRAGYEAREHNSQGCEARTRLELSKAIKCPHIATHLTTCKTVQQALTRPGALNRFLPSDKIDLVKETLMEMYSLDKSPDGMRARDIVTDSGKVSGYVLKANGDGGGHNVYREDIPPFLAAVEEDKWCTFTLMKLIEPPQIFGVLMTPDDVYQGEVVSELGILGTCIWTKHAGNVEMLRNDSAGWTLKTKPSNVDGIMVVKGFGVMDCPALE